MIQVKTNGDVLLDLTGVAIAFTIEKDHDWRCLTIRGDLTIIGGDGTKVGTHVWRLGRQQVVALVAALAALPLYVEEPYGHGDSDDSEAIQDLLVQELAHDPEDDDDE